MSFLSLKIKDKKALAPPCHFILTQRNIYAGLALHFLYYLPTAPTMTLKLHPWTCMIWFTMTVLPFLSGKKEAFSLQNGKAVNDTSLSTLTGSHQQSQGEITLLPMYLMVFSAQGLLGCSSKSLPHDILQPAAPECFILEGYIPICLKLQLQCVCATSHQRYKILEPKKDLFNLFPSCWCDSVST